MLITNKVSLMLQFFRDLTGNKIQDVSIDAVKKFPHLTTL